MSRSSLALAISFLALGGCITILRSTAAAASYEAPWTSAAELEFRDLLTNYGFSNLHLQREAVLDRYLRSQTKTFDRYIAAKEVGVGLAALQQEALAEIQGVSGELRSKLYRLRTTLRVLPYDPLQGGFPIYEQPFDVDASVRHTNDDVRLSKGAVAEGYGFTEAELWFSKVGWVLQATPEQAVRKLETLSMRSGVRRVAVAMTYSLDRCDASESQPEKLVCKISVRHIYAYNSPDEVRPDNPPVQELLNSGSR